MLFAYLSKMNSAWSDSCPKYRLYDANKIIHDNWIERKNLDYLQYLKFEYLNYGVFGTNAIVTIIDLVSDFTNYSFDWKGVNKDRSKAQMVCSILLFVANMLQMYWLTIVFYYKQTKFHQIVQRCIFALNIFIYMYVLYVYINLEESSKNHQDFILVMIGIMYIPHTYSKYKQFRRNL